MDSVNRTSMCRRHKLGAEHYDQFGDSLSCYMCRLEDAMSRYMPRDPRYRYWTGDDGWLAAVREAAEFAAPARALVVALGVDAAAGDPESPLEVSAAGYRQAGRILGELGLPTVIVQEGGYDLATIGSLVVETLAGVESSA